MQCPHCGVHFHDGGAHESYLDEDIQGWWSARSRICPECQNIVVELVLRYDVSVQGSAGAPRTETSVTVHPVWPEAPRS